MRESARAPTPKSATSATCGCRDRPACPVTRPTAPKENLRSSNATSVEPHSSAWIQSAAASRSTASIGTGAMAAAVPCRARAAKVQKAVKGVWSPWGVAYLAGRAEGTYVLFKLDFDCLFAVSSLALFRIAHPGCLCLSFPYHLPPSLCLQLFCTAIDSDEKLTRCMHLQEFGRGRQWSTSRRSLCKGLLLHPRPPSSTANRRRGHLIRD